MNTPDAARQTPAATMYSTLANDPQFRIPLRPQLCRGLHIVDTPTGVLIDGAAERQHLRGSSATALRERLFPLLDGTRETDALAKELGWPEKTVRNAVATLYFAGLLEDAATEVEPPRQGPSERAAIWMSRTLDCSRVFPHSSHMARLAAAASVRYVLRPPWQEPLCEALRDVGITDVAEYDPAAEPPGDTVVLLDLAAPLATLDDAFARCAERGLRTLLVDGRDDRIEVGPFVDPTATACLTCARTAVCPDSGAETEAPADTPPPQPLAAAGLIAEELRALLLRNESPASMGGQLRLDLTAATSTVRKLTPEPDCPVCYPSSRETAAPVPDPAPLHYEYAVGFPPRHLIDPKAHQHHFRPENVGLQFERLRYPNNPRRPLPDATLTTLRDAGSAAGGRRPPSWPEALAAILRFSTGLRAPADHPADAQPGRVLRWSPTGGNLGSPHAYALLTGLPDLPDGIHYYDAAEHALTAMHPHTDHLNTVLADTGAGERSQDRPGEPPSVHLVLAAELGRVARKYGPFSYRVGNLDAGCAITQLALVSHQLGLSVRLLDPGPWQPHRERLVGVSGPPLITAVVRLTREGTTPCH
ncbi:TOMM precursor leader peptide-binding protein [Streptomyces sp. x-80]|uniref:TOMM precursor leader peptide-binding protein n=1 Tax=Streptomyces sp. x-80 TaxID=2789282 RepID=UPI0039807594